MVRVCSVKQQQDIERTEHQLLTYKLKFYILQVYINRQVG